LGLDVLSFPSGTDGSELSHHVSIAKDSTMNRPHDPAASRRDFLKKVFVTAAAAATGTVAANARADEDDGDDAREYNLQGILPARHVVGGVILETEEETYLVFDANQTDEFGAPWKQGKAVIRLDGCVDWKFRMLGDEHLAPHHVDYSELDSQGTYEVRRSTWIEKLAEEDDELNPRRLHHYIVTFHATAFECVVTELDPFVHRLSFAEIHQMLLEI
jgi:hypothetical protein